MILHAAPDPEAKEQEFTLQDFAPGSTSLSAHDQQVMQQVADLIKGSSNVRLTFVGYADNQQVAAGSRYANNMEISIARAQAAADYARAHVDVDGAQVFIVGRGSSDDSDSRRTVIQAYDQVQPATAVAGSQSDVQDAAVKGLSPADEPETKEQGIASVTMHHGRGQAGGQVRSGPQVAADPGRRHAPVHLAHQDLLAGGARHPVAVEHGVK